MASARIAIPADLLVDSFVDRDRSARIVRWAGATMGTTWSVTIAAPRDCDQAPLSAGIQAQLDDVVAQMSNWDADSDISRFNRTPPGTWQSLPPAFAHVLAAGLDVASASSGAFDPAIGRLVDNWGFGPGGIAALAKTPAAAVPQATPAFRSIELDGARVRRLADVHLDFSGIAKGHGVDAVAAFLRDAGIRNFLVEVGGELHGAGVKPDGQPWWVDLEVPPGLTIAPMRVALCGLSVATSGDYRRFVTRNGAHWSHSMDPRTGRPVGNAIRSVSVLHQSCMMADAWATALLVLGVEEGLRHAARHDLAAYMVTQGTAGAREWMSPALADMLAD